MDALYPQLVAHLNYWVYIALMMIGMFAIAVKNNLVKKIIGLNILQTAVILFFISIGAKTGATIPILTHGGQDSIAAGDYINPLPHVLMLTAIVVAVATLGVALALVIRIYRQHGTLEEDQILHPDATEADRPPGGGP